ncbi:DUF1054 family protein [Alkalibacterium olivapovliticus]|uniref:Uncharacterized protein YktB (UPF0637 family) n=1 Tax=Alkalibacterium olivapovliticus TaxID=99907 RepID=A0A2T0WBD2_9LACT|nr:DUF1054 family protein [Alkalibacterium olivapovliticus]PRY83936.1 uncharacterized protein YktB (UPF0637 family) [Alkalibacterium olivapovliticus]
MDDYFKKEDFTLFQVDGLEDRMQLIRDRIQPVFQTIGDTFIEKVNKKTDFEGAFHIAQHRRRTTNPPESTWSAFGGNKRGYKKYPHIQVGINQDYVFMFLSLIDNPKHEKAMGTYLIENSSVFNHLSEDYYISKDHTKPDIDKATKENIDLTLDRLISVKKGEFLIGRILKPQNKEIGDLKCQKFFFEKTLDDLLPIYSRLLQVHFKNEE